MRLVLALLIPLLLLLTTACTAPPPTEQQLAAYTQYAQLRATDAAAAEIIAAAKATEAAAAQQIAQLTAVAAPSAVAITVTTTLTPTQIITSTTPLTASVEADAITGPLTPTVEITATATVTPSVVVTSTLVSTPTLRAPATAEITATATLTPTATPTATATATATPTATVIATVAPSATPIPTTTPTPQATQALTETWPALSAGATASPAITATLAAPTPTSTPAGSVAVTSQQANLRGGPGMAFDVLATARRGDTLDVYGSDAAQNWWRVCCIDGKAGWVSRTIVRFQGDAQAVPVIGPLLPDDLRASWAMRWECHGRGCDQEACIGQSQASALRVVSDRWLEVKRTATWEDACGEPEDWLIQVDRYTGRERQNSANPPLFNIWQGANPGPANRSVELAGAPLSLWCTDTRTQEQPQDGGWTAVFEGQACYDTESGILALMQYVKRWLFSGVIEGQTFENQYFGDYEVIQQVLTDTNAPLSGR